MLSGMITRQRIGMILIGIGFFFMMGIAGTDDFNTAHHVFTSVFPLIGKALIGLIGIGFGVFLLEGGESDESDL